MFRARSEASWRWRRAFREAEAAVMGLVLRGVLRPDADVFHDVHEAWTAAIRRSLGLDAPMTSHSDLTISMIRYAGASQDPADTYVLNHDGGDEDDGMSGNRRAWIIELPSAHRAVATWNVRAIGLVKAAAAAREENEGVNDACAVVP